MKDPKSLKISPEMEDLKNNIISQIQPIAENETSKSAIEKASAQYFPVSRNEEWKYSPFTVPKDARFFVRQGASSSNGSFENSSLEGCYVINFVDGVYFPSSQNEVLPSGVQLEEIQKLEPMIAGYEENIFSSLNAATAHLGGIRVKVATKAIIEKTLVFAFHFSESDNASWIQPRIQVQVGERAEVSFAEIWNFKESVSVVANAISEITVAASSFVKWVSFEKGKSSVSLVNQTRVEIEDKSVFQHVVVSLGEGYVRNNLEIKINGKEGDAHMYGLSLGDKKFHVDHHTFVNHKAENTTSNQLYKSILAGKSTGVFNGKILVDQVAQKTNAYQSSKNILLSNDAKTYAKPQLEIFADDVKCSHGATIGQLDEEPIFYLRSRGLDEVTAKKLLIHAFASEILMKIDNEALKAEIGLAVEDSMAEMLS